MEKDKKQIEKKQQVLKSLKLNKLSENELEKREMRILKGGSDCLMAALQIPAYQMQLLISIHNLLLSTSTTSIILLQRLQVVIFKVFTDLEYFLNVMHRMNFLFN